VALVLADQEDAGSRTVLASVQRVVVAHKQALDEM